MNKPKVSATPRPPIASSSEVTILVIDDSPDMLILVKTILEMSNYRVITAESGNEGLKILSEMTKPNLILLDMHLEDMTGLQFLDALEKERPSILLEVPIVFLTGANTVPDSRAVGFIRKPPDLRQFVDAIQHYVELGQKDSYSQ